MSFVIGPAGSSNILSVPGGFQILWDSGITEAVPGEGGPIATVRYKLNRYTDRYSFTNQLLGLWTGTYPSSYFYVGPYAYPQSTNLVCTRIDSIDPFGHPAINATLGLPWLVTSQCIVQATFTRPQWQASLNGGYFAVTFQGGGEFFTVPETTYRFADSTPTATPIGVMVPQAEITVTRYRMPFVPDSIMIPLIGKVNNAPFQILYNTYNTGTLLFSIGNSSVQSDPSGAITYQFEYKFSYREYPWNFYFHPDRTTGFALVTDGNGAPPYASASFEVLP